MCLLTGKWTKRRITLMKYIDTTARRRLECISFFGLRAFAKQRSGGHPLSSPVWQRKQSANMISDGKVLTCWTCGCRRRCLGTCWSMSSRRQDRAPYAVRTTDSRRIYLHTTGLPIESDYSVVRKSNTIVARDWPSREVRECSDLGAARKYLSPSPPSTVRYRHLHLLFYYIQWSNSNSGGKRR